MPIVSSPDDPRHPAPRGGLDGVTVLRLRTGTRDVDHDVYEVAVPPPARPGDGAQADDSLGGAAARSPVGTRRTDAGGYEVAVRPGAGLAAVIDALGVIPIDTILVRAYGEGRLDTVLVFQPIPPTDDPVGMRCGAPGPDAPLQPEPLEPLELPELPELVAV